MSNALDALMGMTRDQVAAYTANPETEGRIVIGPDRFITVPESLKRIAVQHDHNIETVTFDCPRYWDEHDLSQMQVYINYRLADGTLDSYPADNVSVSGDVMNFDWTISGNVTKLKGPVTFLVCAKDTDSSGKEITHWNTELCSDMNVSEGLECTEQIAHENTDLVTQLLLRMDSVEKINVQADEMRTLHDETATTATEVESAKNAVIEAQTKVEESAEEIRNLYSNAIVGTASGEAIRVDDVSPIEHTVEVKARSKNLYDISIATYHEPSNGYQVRFKNFEYGETYTVTSDVPMSWFKVAGNHVSGYGIAEHSDYVNGGFTTFTFTLKKRAEVPDNAPLVFAVDNYERTAIRDLDLLTSMNIRVNKGTVSYEFTPYVDVSDVEVTACGKNMFDSSKLIKGTGWTEENGVYSGYAFPVHDKYNHTINSPLVTGFKPDTRYVMTCKSYVEIQNGAEEQTGLVLQFKYSDGTLSSMYIKHPVETEYKIISTPGKTVIGVFATYGSSIITHIRDIQVEEGIDPTPYEPYIGSTGDITSVSPTMTVMPNKTGVILDIEYNKDINTVFDEINSLLELLLNGGV